MKEKTVTKLREGDDVIVLSGKYKDAKGVIKKILPNNKCIVSGVALVKKHKKATKQGEKSEIITKEAPISLSKVSYVSGDKAVKLGYRIEDGKKVRYIKKENKTLITNKKKSNG